jgi:hypothetical protein
MKKFLLLLTLFFATESEAGESPVTEDDWDKFTTAVVVVGGIAFITAYSIRQSKGIGSSEYIYFDENSNSIIFSEETGLQNLEINFSSQISQDFFPTNNLHSSDNLYLGFKYRF